MDDRKVKTAQSAVALLHLGSQPPEHEQDVQLTLAKKIAAMLNVPLQADLTPSATVYWIPDETVIGSEQMQALGIRHEANFFGGAVPYPFMATKAISHPLIEHPAAVVEGWSERFDEQASSAVLRGFTVFDLADAERAGLTLLAHGPLRIKPVRGKAGRGQELIEDAQQLTSCLLNQDAVEVGNWGLVLEEHLKEVVTFSVGQVLVAGITASYCGTQRLTQDDSGAEVYGGSDLILVRGDYDQLGALPLSPALHLAIEQAVRYEQAALDCLGLVASRRNYDIAQGIDSLGEERSGVLEQSWRIGGASAAEIFALEAFYHDPALQRLRASTYETYGADTPANAQRLYHGAVPPHGTLSKFVKVEPYACP
ncbi:DUF3182 family protein [Pseudomonas turukhanskensis]|uniref:Biotin carboxylase n=1 Tax=Pseudomonas turukhanskensis TaxID=1806536 RepID=A0A9W6NFM1_9PSED|nr:DUF3182 family protein [Pseudomonas turukhanskensis]GLK88977.1 hypothetical protein GCM10017655_20390 [Pseudomonas turukhanskensis]